MISPRLRGAALLLVLLLTVAASLAGLLLFLRVVERRQVAGDGRAAAIAAAESAMKSVTERLQGEEGPALVQTAGFSPDSAEAPLLHVQLEGGAVADVARPRYAGASGRGGSNLDRANQSGFVTQTWKIASSGRSVRAAEEVRFRADLILGPAPIDVSHLPEPD